LVAMGPGVMERWFGAAYRAREQIAVRGHRMMLERAATEGYLAAVHALCEADLGARAAAITSPTLVITGEADVSTPVAQGRALAAAIAGARFEILPGVGHLSCVEAPEAFVALLARFLGEHGIV